MVSSTRIFFVLSISQAAAAVRLWPFDKRGDTSPHLPERQYIPLTFDDSGRYVAEVSMSTGGKQQHFNFTMTTSSGLTYVAGTRCDVCSGTNLYNQGESATAQTLSPSTNVSLFGQSTGSSIIIEDCKLRTVNGSQWDYPNQTIIVVDQPPDNPIAADAGVQVGSGLSGIIGIATNKNAPSKVDDTGLYTGGFLDSIMGQWLLSHPQFDNFTFGMMLGRPVSTVRGNSSSVGQVDTTGANPGELHWLQPDPAFYDPAKVVWKQANIPNNPLPFASNNDWIICLDGWALFAEDTHVLHSESVSATVEPLYAEIFLPMREANEIHLAIQGSVARSDLGSLRGLSQAWTIPCDAVFSFGIVAGSQTYILDQNTLVLQQPDGTCISSIEGWMDPYQVHTVLGQRFLSTIYLIFNVPRDGPNTMGIAPRTVKQANHTGAIVGGTVGGVAFLIITGFIVFFFFLYRHRQCVHRVTHAQYDPQIVEKNDAGDIDPFPLSAMTPTTVHFAHAPESPIGSDMTSVPLTAAQILHYDSSMEPAPPSYESFEDIRRVNEPFARNEKASRSHTRVSSASLSGPSYSQIAGSSSLALATAASGSATAYE